MSKTQYCNSNTASFIIIIIIIIIMHENYYRGMALSRLQGHVTKLRSESTSSADRKLGKLHCVPKKHPRHFRL